MALTVFADGLGLFHQSSGGKGVAPGDVCLSPPPPPAGPVPVPYVNMVQASDLADGSTTVRVDGSPTALSDQSNISTSSGDEAGTQGGNVVTAQTKGKAYFSSWSHTVTVEGEGVCRHSDMLGQNCASQPFGIVDPCAITRPAFPVKPEHLGKPCPPGKEKAPATATNESQRESVREGPCWSCGAAVNQGVYKSGKSFNKGDHFVADHQPPQSAVWAMGGCHDEEAFNTWKKSNEAVQPHCTNCSNNQGQVMRANQGQSVLAYLSLAWP